MISSCSCSMQCVLWPLHSESAVVSSSASWILVRPPWSCISGHGLTIVCAVGHWHRVQMSGSGSAVSTIGTAGRSQVAGWKGRILDTDWPQKPTTSLLPTALLCRRVLLLPKWGDEMWLWVVAQDDWFTISTCSGHSGCSLYSVEKIGSGH